MEVDCKSDLVDPAIDLVSALAAEDMISAFDHDSHVSEGAFEVPLWAIHHLYRSDFLQFVALFRSMRELLLILKLQHDTFYWLQVHYSRARSESRYVQLAKLAQQVDKRVESCVIILV